MDKFEWIAVKNFSKYSHTRYHQVIAEFKWRAQQIIRINRYRLNSIAIKLENKMKYIILSMISDINIRLMIILIKKK